MKTNTIFKRAYNRCLDSIAACAPGDDLGTENQLADGLAVSRTTVRAVIEALRRAGLVAVDGRRRTVLRRPEDGDFYAEVETESLEAIIEKNFMEWTLHGNFRPGQQINGLDLARQFGVSPSAMREFFTRFSHFGLLQRRPNSRWVFLGFDIPFAEDLCEVRELFELRSAERFCRLSEDHPAWRRLAQLERQHISLLSEMDARFSDFSALDEQFHRLIHSVAPNRFITGFFTTLSIVFHYHYLWNKEDEKERNIVAIQEHLTYIAALRSGDRDACLNAARAHMRTARTTMLNSIQSVRGG